MTRKLLFFSLIFLFISCTVTKRLHRPGYHIQWRKIERTQSPEKQSKTVNKDKINSFNKEKVALLSKEIPVDSTSLEMNTKQESISRIVAETKNSNRIALHSPAPQESSIKPTLSKKHKRSQSFSQKSIRPIFWRLSAKNLKTIGVVLICIGLMILFASLLVYWGAFSGSGNNGGNGAVDDGAGGGVAWLNLFLDLILISDWFWLLVFIVLFILITYLFFLLVMHVFGGPFVGTLVGLAFLALGIFFFALGKGREISP